MKQVLTYFLLSLGFLILQTALLPKILPFSLKPDLLLILVVYLGLTEGLLRGGSISALLGCLQDVFVGTSLGLYGFVLLAVFLGVRSAVDRLNTESSLLLLFVVCCGTLLEGGLLLFAVGFFAETGPIWPILLGRLLPQVALNLAAALLMLRLLLWIRKRLPPHVMIPGLQHLDRRYES